MAQENAVFETDLKSLPLSYRGKVRDIYKIGDGRMLFVATDRLSAFDVILPTPIPGKGCVLTEISNFWFHKTADIVPNHLVDVKLDEVVSDHLDVEEVAGRAVVVEELKPLPIEAIVRGYIIGSGWKEYQESGSVCGIRIPEGLQLAEKLPQPIYTPSTKAAVGEHDENISYEKTVDLIGAEMAATVRDISLQLYTYAAHYAKDRGIIIADTKFEFGTNKDGELVLMDEALTPDSSRFWPASTYRPGMSPASFDKQYVRDYLETLSWDKKAPGPELPEHIANKTADKYREALKLITGRD